MNIYYLIHKCWRSKFKYPFHTFSGVQAQPLEMHPRDKRITINLENVGELPLKNTFLKYAYRLLNHSLLVGDAKIRFGSFLIKK